jgi:hypothetical protein
MFALIVTFNSILVLLYVWWAYLYAKRKGTGLTFFLTSSYALTNGLFIFFNQTAASFYSYQVSDAAVMLACLSNVTFLGVAFVLTKARLPVLWRPSRLTPVRGPSEVFLVGLGLLIVLVQLRYLVLGGGAARVLELRNVIDRDSLYLLRYDESLAIAEGSGLFMALTAMRVAFPLFVLGLSYVVFVRRRWSYILFAIPVCIINGLTALSTLQRSPFFNFVVITFFAIAWGVFVAKYRRGANASLLSPRQLIVVLLILLVGAAIYAFTEGAGLFIGAYGLLERSFLIPSFGTTLYFDLFGSGKAFEHAGARYFLGFPVDQSSGGITYRDIGLAANGWSHNLNASFVATAYAALSFPGVIAISVIVVLITRFIDQRLLALPLPDRLAIIVLNIFVVFEVCNGPLMNGVLAGFAVNVLLYLFLFKRISISIYGSRRVRHQ